MALIKCPECGKEISDKAGSCPNCGCPIANAPTSIKVRALSDDRGVNKMRFKVNGIEVGTIPIGSTITINMKQPTRVEAYHIRGLSTGTSTFFNAVPGKCYEARYCKPGLLMWETVVTEVSFIS